MSECQAGGSEVEEEADVDVGGGGDAAASPLAAAAAAATSSAAESDPFPGDSQTSSLSGESVGHAPPAPACGEGREGKAVEKERREDSRWRRG